MRSDGGRPLVHAGREGVEAMEITSDTTKIRLAAFQLEGEAQYGGNWQRPLET